MTFNELFTSSTWTPFLPVLDAIAKSTIVLAVAGIATVLLHRASAASRHLVWTAALIGVLLLPVVSIAIPRWQMPVVTVAAPASAEISPVADAASQQMAASIQARLKQRATDRAGADAPGAANTSTRLPVSWQSALLLVWVAGAALVLARLLIGFVAVQVISRRTEDASHSSWMSLARSLARELRISRIAFRRSGRASMPMAFGVVKPTVLMPAAADDWPESRLRIVLLHELAHVKRRDCLTHMLAQLACALYWFNPLVWIAARRIRAERERACDDLVLAAGTPSPDYADQLLEIARVMRAGRFRSVTAGASLAMAHRSQLEGRLMAILDPSIPRSGVSRMRTLTAALVAAAALLPLASMQTWTYEASAAMLPGTTELRSGERAPQAPTPTPSPVASKIVDDARQGAVEGAVQGALQGAIQGSRQAAVPGVVQDVIANAVPGAIDAALDAVLGGSQEARAKSDPKLIAALTAALKDSDKEVRETAMHALVKMRDPRVFEPLVQALKDAAPDVRSQAAFGLGQMRDKRAIEPLIGALKDNDAEVREQVAFALGRLRDRAAVDALGAALRDSSASVREQVVFALGQLRDQRSVEPLISALKDEQPNVREQAAFALGQLRAAAAVEALVIALKDNDPDVREQAAFALGQIRDARAIDALTAALKDPNASVRQQAAFALGQLAR